MISDIAILVLWWWCWAGLTYLTNEKVLMAIPAVFTGMYVMGRLFEIAGGPR